MIWTPDANDNGYYMIIFEAESDGTVVRDTIIVEVTDTNGYPPALTLSTSDTSCPVNLPIVIYARATDLDGTPPNLKISGMPSGATFDTDDEGNGIFRWTPSDTGTFIFTVTAYDQVDLSTTVSQLVTIRITDENVTGPIFAHHPDVTINQNQKLELLIQATDQDGTIPSLVLTGKPKGASFTDNKDGSGTIYWQPGCDVSGTYIFTAVASDQSFSDSISITVVVRDVNCAPVIYSTPNINVQPGEMVHIAVQAYDPDNDGTIPTITVSCDLPGFTFISPDDGTGTFGWQAPAGSGSYPVIFYATDGISTDSTTTFINVNKTGAVSISGYPRGIDIYAMPCGSYSGEYLGKDSVVFSAAPGTYFFEIKFSGYRTQRFTCNIKADTTVSTYHTLKTAIPLMLAPAETLITQNGN